MIESFSHLRARILIAAAAGATIVSLGRAQAPQKHPDFSGAWAFNASQSDQPRNPNGRGDDTGQTNAPAAGPTTGNGGYGGRGGRGGFGGGGFGGGGFGGGRGRGAGGLGGAGQASRGNTDDRVKTLELTDEIRNPPASLTITQKGDTVTILDANNHTRVFHTTGKKDTQQLEAVKVDTKTTWDGERLVTEYDLGNDRKLRYTYSIADDPRQLLVEVAFQNGKNAPARADVTKFVYDLAPAKPQ